MYNVDGLSRIEGLFLERYPGGFEDQELVRLAVKHKVKKMSELAGDSFQESRFSDPDGILDSVQKIIGTSSVVSVFEKQAFRNYAKSIDREAKENISAALFELLYGDEKDGFDRLLDLLKGAKLAKWTLMTVLLAYSDPAYHVFIKPTTAKNVIAFFEIEELKYSPTPSYEFYAAYRELILSMKKNVDKRLQTDNLAFGGFLMMGMELAG